MIHFQKGENTRIINLISNWNSINGDDHNAAGKGLDSERFKDSLQSLVIVQKVTKYR